MISDMEPEVVITDIKMPKMDGLSMIRQAKEMGASCDFVILVVMQNLSMHSRESN